METWHKRLAHINFDVLKFLSRNNLIFSSSNKSSGLCYGCALAKSCGLPFESLNKSAFESFDQVQCDCWGSSPLMAHQGMRYYSILSDDCTRYCWIFPLKEKTEFSGHFEKFLVYIKTQFNKVIKSFHSDCGTEFVNKIMQAIFTKNNIHHIMACPYMPQQNSQAEKNHQTVTARIVNDF